MIEILNQQIDPQGLESSHYRILIDKTHFKYLTIDPHIYATDDLCSPETILSKLPAFPTGGWNFGRISKTIDRPYPHFAEATSKTYPCITPLWHSKSYDYLSLKIGEPMGKPNVYKCTSSQLDGTVIAKFARFPWEIGYYIAESEIYQLIEGQRIGPDFLGYIIEGERTIGFLLSFVMGRHAGPADLAACKAIVGKLHALGVLHGDLNKFNFFVGEKGITLIDFETAKKCDDEVAMKKELEGLEALLGDDLGEGNRVFGGDGEQERIHELMIESQSGDVTVTFPTQELEVSERL